MDGGKTILRISEASHQAGNCGQSQLDPKASEAVKGGQVIVNGRDHDGIQRQIIVRTRSAGDGFAEAPDTRRANLEE
jgi:hypothetical protein